ncbi:MAG TPA: aminodeoxychorismate/anthranilate synthase component II [Blastocatellia bacterium]|nr:aminodeoxychorismate/anthranilate synthase component II [Blastocatellia bacterium]
MILVIDNYDSFTYNLVQYLGELGVKSRVYRNDAVTIKEIRKLQPERILISPGPGVPRDAGITIDLIRSFSNEIPILGVCLGHQAIGEAFGGRVIRAPYLMHGKISEICHDSATIFRGIPYRFKATRYHSLIVEKDSLPNDLEVSATTPDGLIMGLRHRSLQVEGVQFHPESVMTEHGKKLLENFLEL